MTNNELIDMINIKIDEIVNERIKELKKYENENSKNYFEALRYHLHQRESENARVYFKSELNDLLQLIDLGTDNTLYREMWEELKEEIENIKEEHIAEINCYVKSNMYGLAEYSNNKKTEDNYILDTINGIEKRRGIGQ